MTLRPALPRLLIVLLAMGCAPMRDAPSRFTSDSGRFSARVDEHGTLTLGERSIPFPETASPEARALYVRIMRDAIARAAPDAPSPFASLEEQTPDDYDRVFATNVRGPYFTIQKALPLLNDGASILITGSVVAVKGFAGASVYSASKAAVRNIARTLTSELAPRGIRINILSPGPIETPIYGKLGKSEAEIGEMAAGFASMVPLGRFGGADETAAAALFLVSDQSSFVTGADLHVDGGLAQV